MLHSKGTEYDTGLDLVKLNVIRDYFMKLRKKYIDNGLLDPSMLATNTNALLYQVPGGMLSNLLSQLKQAGKADQLDDVLKEVQRFERTQVIHHLLHLHHRSLVHRLCLT